MTDWASQVTTLVGATKQKVCSLAVDFSGKGWLPATSGNLSVRVPGTSEFCVTRSGADKQQLTVDDVLWLDAAGELLESTTHRPSAETIVHQLLYAKEGCGAVVHVHTVHNNLISDIWFGQGYVLLNNHELLKALGYWEEGARVEIPIVENFANLPTLAEAVSDAIHPGVPAVLVRNHGIYAWGDSDTAAKRHLEALEFLFEYLFLHDLVRK